MTARDTIDVLEACIEGQVCVRHAEKCLHVHWPPRSASCDAYRRSCSGKGGEVDRALDAQGLSIYSDDASDRERMAHR